MTSQIRPLAYASPYLWIFWAVFLAAYAPEFAVVARSKRAAGEKTDRGSMTFIILASWLAFPAAFAVSSWSRFALLHHRIVWFALGIAILAAGSMLRRYCFHTLGRFFTGNVKVHADHTVIEDGPYRLVRHPSYTGGMLMYLGTGLALTNWLSAVILVGMGAITYAYRVRVEEQALGTSIGQPYLEYMRRTKRFVPFVF
ncbi:MAG TPA: isoprenylcysteine carboxylmethyltransferase family protein [Terriglobales bacterium]|nr:isoprenylcysteine carboxylmethyltransferase family protein [Terriglobales bacterium]